MIERHKLDERNAALDLLRRPVAVQAAMASFGLRPWRKKLGHLPSFAGPDEPAAIRSSSERI
jgi:hypothetical protein